MGHARLLLRLFSGPLFFLCMLIMAGLLQLLVGLSGAIAETRPRAQVPDETQARIVRLYSEGKCAEVRSIAKSIDLMSLRANVMAIVAYCDPPGVNPETLFAKAEQLSPTGDLILVLHAKHRWKKNPKAAEPLWKRVLMIARNEYFREMAKDYLSGVIDPGTAEHSLNLSPATGFAQFFFGGEHRTTAQLPDFVYQPSVASYGAVARGDLTYRHWYQFGSVAVHFTGSYDHYFSATQYTLWDNNLELPLAIHVSSNKDLVVRPFTGYTHMGTGPLRFLYGVGVVGAVYKASYTQSVQGLVYADRILVPAISDEQGAHYRFEYQWDFYPKNWFFSTMISVEHVSATPASQLFGSGGFFEMSHTDSGVNFKVERDFSRFTLGFVPQLVFRTDSQATIVNAPAVGVSTTSKRRQDYDVSLMTDLTIPLLPSLQLYAWYEWRRIFSDFGPGDYVDRNYNDQTVGVGVKTSLSTY